MPRLLSIPMLERHYMRNVTRRLPINSRRNRNTGNENENDTPSEISHISHIIPDCEGNDDGDTIMSSILDNLDNIFDDEGDIATSENMYTDIYDDVYQNSDFVRNDMYYDMPSLITETDEHVDRLSHQSPQSPQSPPPQSTNATTSAAAASLTPLRPEVSVVSHLDMDDTIREILLNLDRNYPGPFPNIIPNPNLNNISNHITISRPWHSSNSRSSNNNDLENISSSVPYTISGSSSVLTPTPTSTRMIRNTVIRRNRNININRNRNRMTIGVTPIFQP